MLLLILILLRTALLQEWRTVMPEHAPNHFLMNVAPEQMQPLRGARARTRRTHGRTLSDDARPHRCSEWRHQQALASAAQPRQHRSELDSERNLSWTATLPANNRIEAGAWWPPRGEPGEPSVSLEEQYADAAGVKVGDMLEFDVGGLPVTARVTSIRRVEWNSMAPNFFILFSPGALQGLAVTYMSSFYLAPEQKPFLNELLAAFPTITVIEVDRVIEQIQSIMTPRDTSGRTRAWARPRCGLSRAGREHSGKQR